jgi:imidazolonepropionase-like amidohydrolase
MYSRRWFLLWATILGTVIFCAESTIKAKEPATATVYRGAKILTAAGKTFDPGVLVVREGKIVDVGPAEKVAIPDGAKVIDVGGKTIIPGLVDTHSHLGVYSRPHVSANSDGNEMTGPVQSLIRALDAINPFDPGIRMAQAGGITTANIMPGSGNVIGGQTLYVKLRGHTVEQMWIPTDDVVGGLKMANGENPKRAYGGKGQAPQTRMKIAALQRSEFIKARDYMRKWDTYRKKLATSDDATPPEVDLRLEPLVEVLQRKRTVHFHTHRADDIMTVLRLADEFQFELVVQHGTEAYKVADELAKRKVPVSMTVVDSPGGKAEVADFLEECGAELTKAGVKVLVNTDDFITESRFLLRTAAIPVRGGLDDEEALRSVTLYPAQVMHLDKKIGSLEAGKDADFVVLSGEPFSVYTRVLQTYIDGVKAFDLADEKQRLYQTGGFAVVQPAQVPAEKPLVVPQAAVAAPSVPPNAKTLTDESKEVVILAGRVHTVSQGTIVDGAILVRDGKIVSVGKRDELKLPKNAAVITAAVVTPGLIDAHSVVPAAGQLNISADQDADEATDPNQADVRILDTFNPREPLLRFLLEQGVTVVHACPGRANVISGLSGVFRTHGKTAEGMTVRFPQTVLLNLGEIPKETYHGKRPGTRMGTAALARSAFTDAAAYSRKVKAAKDDAGKPDRNLANEHLALALDRKIGVMFCAQRADDIGTALRLQQEFKLKGIVALAAEAYLAADELAATQTPIIVHPTMQRVSEMETYHSFLGNAAALADRKLRVAIGSGVEAYVPKTRVVRHEAGIAMVHGLGFDGALKAITLDAAKILEIDDRFGSLEAGKVADLVLYDGDPFEHRTHVTAVLVDGRLVFDRQERQRIPFVLRAMGGLPEVPCCLSW